MVTRVKIEVANARGVAERWRKQYWREDESRWTRTVSGDSEQVYNKLCDLGESPPVGKVAEVIGNKSWSFLTCNGCGEHVEMAANLTREYSGSDENFLCEQCVRDAFSAFSALTARQGA